MTLLRVLFGIICPDALGPDMPFHERKKNTVAAFIHTARHLVVTWRDVQRALYRGVHVGQERTRQSHRVLFFCLSDLHD